MGATDPGAVRGEPLNERPYLPEIRAEQLSIALANLPTTLISSALIALSGAVVLNIEGGYWWIPWWVAAVVAVAIVRGLWLLRLRSRPEATRDTEACLRQAAQLWPFWPASSGRPCR